MKVFCASGSHYFKSIGLFCPFSDDYCESPCVPVGSDVMSLDQSSFYLGKTLTFACYDKHFVNGTIDRTCMENKKWDRRDIDCQGKGVE